MSSGRLAVGVAATCAAAGFAAPPAMGGAFEIRVCTEADLYSFSSDAFSLSSNSRSVLAGRDCRRYGGRRTEGGVITRTPRKSGRAGYGHQAVADFVPPAGTTVVAMRWSGLVKRCDAAWDAGLYAKVGKTTRALTRPKARCPEVSARAAKPPPPKALAARGATRIFQKVSCASRRGCSTAPVDRGSRVDVRTYGARITVLDPVLPTVRGIGGPLASGRWVSGVQPVSLTTTDNVGIRRVRVRDGARGLGGDAATCNFAQRIPCAGVAQRLAVPTTQAGEGLRNLTIDATDSANNVRSLSFRALIDNTPPPVVRVNVAGGEGWRRRPGFVLRWPTAPEPDRAPVDGAWVQLRRAGATVWGPATYRPSALAGTTVTVPEGAWEARVWRRDAAGNGSSAFASAPVLLRYDPEPPEPSFEPQDRGAPARVSALVRERVSGLAGGEIELRREGEQAWRVVATRRQGSRLVADVDDAALPAGVYALRARAFDQAGNQGLGERRADGFPAVMTLPARARAVLRGGAARRQAVRRRIRRNGRRRLVRRRATRLVSSLRARYGRTVRLRGSLRTPGGGPLVGAALEVTERPAAGTERRLAVIRTDSHGRWRWRTRASQTAVLRVVYAGTRTVLPSERQVSLRVPAASSLRAAPRRTRNGRTVRFTGRVRTKPVPIAGKLVELQAHFRGRWRTFQTVRSDSRGRWRFRYRFGATRGRVRYRFRVLLPAEGDYPYVTGVSRAVRVTVVGP